MSVDELRALADRADGVDGWPATRVGEVQARIATHRRRRAVAAVVAAVLAVVLAISATTAVLAMRDTAAPHPVRQPRSLPTPTPDPQDLVVAAPHRELVWARGRVVHVGNRKVDVGGRVWNVMATDDGAVFTREAGANCFRDADGCNDLWFTDGAEIARLGTVYGSVIRGFELHASSSGSTLVWFEPSPEDHPHGSGYEHIGQHVVYDTGTRHEVARLDPVGSGPDRNGWVHLLVEAVFDDVVYWTPDDRADEWCADWSRYAGQCRRHRSVMRLDVATGAQAKVPWSAYVAERRSRARMFFASTYRADLPFNAFPSEHPGQEELEFHVSGDRFVADYYGGTGAVTVRLGGAESRVRLRPPRGYHFNDTNLYRTLGWLDDEHLVVVADNRDDLLVCRLPDGRCRVAVERAPVVDFAGRG